MVPALRSASHRLLVVPLAVLLLVFAAGRPGKSQAGPGYRPVTSEDVADLSVRLDSSLPITWPAGLPYFQIVNYRRHSPGPAASDWIFIDEHTGTQFDAPAHFVPPPDSGLPNAGPNGLITADKVPIWQFCGEACVIDVTDMLGKAKKGASPIITKERVQQWEKQNRLLRPGDVVLFRSGYDRFFRKLPQGQRFVAKPLNGDAVGWPDPDPECIKYLVSRGVMAAGTDSPSMGPIPDLAADTHIAGGQAGMIWTEMATGLDRLPTTGAFYAFLGPKHAKGSASEGRALAVVNKELARSLIRAATFHNVVDLTVLLDDNLPVWWPGAGTGNHAQPYVGMTLHYFDQPGGPYYSRGHIMDTHNGTHLDPPSHFLPPPGFEPSQYSADIRARLKRYEKQYGKRKFSDVTTEKVPLAQMMGPARVIDVRDLIGTTEKGDWPSSPLITVTMVRAYEKASGPIQRGEVVLFRSDWQLQHFKPFPEGEACTKKPLNGETEGWPAPTPELMVYLSKKGVRCVGTDGTSMGSTDPEMSTFIHWAGAGENIVFVEQLTNLNKLPEKGAFFIFAPIKLVGGHGGPGRAIALLP